MMESIVHSAMMLMLLAFGGLLLVGGRALTSTGEEGRSPLPRPWPAVALLVPVTGAAADLPANLLSLLSQDYPDYQVIFITRDLEDPATQVIAALIPEHPRARLVVSGPAVSCGQKNHNLLAGLKTMGDHPEILVFCDSTRLAPADWLKGMARPLVMGKAPVISGYHHVLPQDEGLPGWGRAVTVLFLFLTKGVSLLNQPWGGATAITRRAFEDLQVARLWARNVVDDVSLAALLQGKGLRVGLAGGESLITPMRGDSLRAWRDWLTRQWLYLKFCLPGSWLAVGLLFYLLAGLVGLSGLLLLAALGGFPLASIWPGAVFLAALTGLALAMKNLHPQPPSLRAWLPAFYGAIFMAAWCHLRTWPLREIHWRGISYRVGWKGLVKNIRVG